MSGDDWVGLVAAGATIVGGFTLLIVFVAQVGASWRARAVAARDQAYRQLAEDMAVTQRTTAADLTEVRERLAAMERLLREV